MGSRKILLVTPPYHAGVVESAGSWMPLSFVYLAGAARAVGWRAEIYDAMTKQHTLGDIAKHFAETDADVIAVSSITSSIIASLDVLRVAKRIRPGVKTIIGGVHPTYCYEDILTENAEIVDLVVCGEGERTLRDLLSALDRGYEMDGVRGVAFRRENAVVTTGARQLIEDIDPLPAAWDLVSWDDYRYFVIPDSRLAAVSTSRGCTHGCTFCSQQKFWNKTWRARAPEAVVEEIEMLNKSFGANVFLIVDEYPTKERDRWEEILDLLISRNLDIYLLMETRVEDITRDEDILWKYRKAGVVHIYVGVEATDQETLDRVKKEITVEQSKDAIRLINEHRMITETSFVLGFPWETKESVERTLQLAKHFNPDFAHFLAIAPWPYADIYEEMEEFIEVYDFSKYNLVEPVICPEAMSLDEVRNAIVDCYRRYYMWKAPEFIRTKDSFKKEYLKRSMRLIMNNSFLSDLVKRTGKGKSFAEMHRIFMELGENTATEKRSSMTISTVMRQPE